MLDESLRRTNDLLVDVRTSESNCEQLREQNQSIRADYELLLSVNIQFSLFIISRNRSLSFRLHRIYELKSINFKSKNNK